MSSIVYIIYENGQEIDLRKALRIKENDDKTSYSIEYKRGEEYFLYVIDKDSSNGKIIAEYLKKEGK